MAGSDTLIDQIFDGRYKVVVDGTSLHRADTETVGVIGSDFDVTLKDVTMRPGDKDSLLVSADGKPVNNQVLNMVGEPLEITGDVEHQGDLLILRADPTTYRRL